MSTTSPPSWRLIDPEGFPAAASMAAGLMGRRRRRRAVPLGRSYKAHTRWGTPAGPVPGIAYQDLPPPTPAPGGGLIANMGARFSVLATAEGLHVPRLAADLSAADLATAREAIRRICQPDTLARYLAAEVGTCANPVCVTCGRPLADPQSRARGVGPDCWQRLEDAIRGAAAVGHLWVA